MKNLKGVVSAQKSKSIFEVERPEDSLGFLLWQVSMVWQRKIRERLEQYDISHSQFVILATLLWFKLHNFDTNQVAIINWTKLDKMTVSKSLKSLVESKLVIRIEDKIDTRAKKVYLTEKGEKTAAELVPIVEGMDSMFFSKLSYNQQQSLIKIFGRLLEQ